MTEQTEQTTTDTVIPDITELEKLVTKLTAGRWLAIRRVLQMSTDEIMTDTVASLIVAANEVVRESNGGRDEFDRLLAMPIPELSKIVGIDSDGGDDSKSDPQPVGEVQPGPVGDAGVADGVVDGAGAVVPADGPVTG